MNVCKYLYTQPLYNFYKAVHLFDPRQLLGISYNINNLTAIKDFKNPSTDLKFFFRFMWITSKMTNQIFLTFQHFGM